MTTDVLYSIRAEIPPDVLVEADGYMFRAVALLRDRAAALQAAESQLSALQAEHAHLVEAAELLRWIATDAQVTCTGELHRAIGEWDERDQSRQSAQPSPSGGAMAEGKDSSPSPGVASTQAPAHNPSAGGGAGGSPPEPSAAGGFVVGQPFDDWKTVNPEDYAAYDAAMYGDRTFGLSLHSMLKGRPASCVGALRRIRENAAHYLEEMRELIDEHHYTAMLHHVGHVTQDMRAMKRLTETMLQVLRNEPAAPTTPVAEPGLDYLDGAQEWLDRYGPDEPDSSRAQKQAIQYIIDHLKALEKRE